MQQSFEEAGTGAGLAVWRIENFQAVPVPSSELGKFYSGDSYIILSTRDDGGTLSWDIHYWFGEGTSQDEAGAAAILAVELDDRLGGGPVQHREVQDHESDKFISYFESGVRYLPGGVASGFNHVVSDQPGETRLYKVKGDRNVRVRLVEADVSSMNKGDCFILDSEDVYVWVGPGSKGTERLKAVTAANRIRDQDHCGRAQVLVLDESSDPDELAKFFEKLGSGSQDDVAEADAAEEREAAPNGDPELFKVSDSGGSLSAELVGSANLCKDMLISEDCFVLDTKGSGIFVWIGRDATSQEKVEALKKGEAFLETNNYSRWTKMERVVEGGEPVGFKEYFQLWE